MGIYINPEGCTKEEWLAANGEPSTLPAVYETDFSHGEKLPVVLINNGPFTGAGVCFSLRELQAFTDPGDFRPKKFYMVDREKLIEVCGDHTTDALRLREPLTDRARRLGRATTTGTA